MCRRAEISASGTIAIDAHLAEIIRKPFAFAQTIIALSVEI
jgi:hypothetical protein